MDTSRVSNADTPVGLGGWLLLYVCASIPYLLFHSAGLSGLIGYPLWLLVTIFLFLSWPLALILLRSPGAPRWNVVVLWVVAFSITLRAATVPFILRSDGAAQRRSPDEWARRDRDPRGHRGRLVGLGDDLDSLLPAIAPRAEHLLTAGRSLARGRAARCFSSTHRGPCRRKRQCESTRHDCRCPLDTRSGSAAGIRAAASNRSPGPGAGWLRHRRRLTSARGRQQNKVTPLPVGRYQRVAAVHASEHAPPKARGRQLQVTPTILARVRQKSRQHDSISARIPAIQLASDQSS